MNFWRSLDRLDILNNEPSPPEKEDKEEHEEESEYEDEEEEIRQIFPSHDALSERLRKTMYYGESDPCGGESLSLSLTEFSVSEFAKGEFRRLDQLNINRAGWISRESCASPTSLLLALLYLERLRSSNPGYLAQTSSTDVFLVSLMVASKFRMTTERKARSSTRFGPPQPEWINRSSTTWK
ncbi:Protein CNPPD1like [Caligus rogercresseyi]|uniref:Protein CNPPD1 n=1 Tax=Caligus rogercresseyi TaxID=217165 RepID=A0A7T8JV83_CALRO|nr:Protein CNPPD1like [Caligus rogercresseyi]